MSFNTGTKVFPSANCIYVDNDFAALRAKGLLAYGTLGDALNAWGSGGEARLKYGTPSATNYATIILGAGTITSGQTEPGGTAYINYDFVNIIGQGKDVTILTNAVAATDYIINIQGFAHTNFSHFTIKCATNAVGAIKFVGITNWSGTLSNLKVTGNPTSTFILLSGSNFRGLIEYCDFDFSGQTGSTQPFTMSSSGDNGTINNCTFEVSSTCPNALYSAGTQFYGIIRGCIFTGSPSSEMIKIDSSASGMRLEDCHIESGASKGLVSTTTDTDPEIIIKDCSFLTDDNCISMLTTALTEIINCNLQAVGTNKAAINFLTGSTGCVIFGSRIAGSDSTAAITCSFNLGIEISTCTLRRPLGGLPGSSIGSTITNNANAPFNTEIFAGWQTGGDRFQQISLGGLVSDWKMDEKTGVRKDSFGNNHLAQFNNVSYVESDPDISGINAAHFVNAGNQYLQKNSNSSLQAGDFDFTICTWVRLTSIVGGASPYFISKGDSGYEYVLYYFAGGSQVYWDVAAQAGGRLAQIGGPGFSFGTWYFVVAWHDSVANTVNIQVNNGTIFSDTTGGGAPKTGNGPLTFGQNNTASDLTVALNGDIDETLFFKRVLSSTEKTFLYRNGNVRTIID